MLGRKTVIFDLDGVLFRTETVDVVAINKALSVNGYPEQSTNEILNCIGITMQDMCDRFGIVEPGKTEKFVGDVIRFEEEEIEQWGLLYEGADNFIKRLKGKGYTLCICSNGSKEYVHKVLGKFGLIEYFDEIWAQTDGYNKSQAVAVLSGRYSDGTFIMVGDRSIDIDAGRDNNGIVTLSSEVSLLMPSIIRVTSSSNSLAQLKELELRNL